MTHLQNGKGTAQEIFHLVQYSSQREEMLMLKEGRSVMCPHRSHRTQMAEREGEAQFTAVDVSDLCCCIVDTDPAC